MHQILLSIFSYSCIIICSAPPPPLQAGTFSRGVVTMRCDLSTCSSAHISLLVSGSAQTCFNDQARRIYFDKSWVVSLCFHLWALQVHKYTWIYYVTVLFIYYYWIFSDFGESYKEWAHWEKSASPCTAQLWGN